MAVLNKLLCFRRKGNSGWGKDCVYHPEPVRTIFLIPKGETFGAENLDDVDTFLEGKLHHDDPDQRWYAFTAVEGMEDNSEDVQEFTFEDRSKIVTSEETEVMTYRFYEGGLCTQKNLLDFDGCEDDKDILYGTSKNKLEVNTTLDEFGNRVCCGFDMVQFYTKAMKRATYAEPASIKIRISHDSPKQMQRDMAVVDMAPTSIEKLVFANSVQNVEIKNVTPAGAAVGTYHVQLLGGCGGSNLVETYGSAIALVALFDVSSDSGAVTVTGATLNSDGDAIILVMNPADSDYPDDGDPLYINMASVSDWYDVIDIYVEAKEPLTIIEPNS